MYGGMKVWSNHFNQLQMRYQFIASVDIGNIVVEWIDQVVVNQQFQRFQ